MLHSLVKETLLGVIDSYWLFFRSIVPQNLYWRFVRRFSRRLFPQAGGKARLAEIHGHIPILVNIQENAGRDLAAGVDFEPMETAVVKAVVKPGDTFIDVGANIGYYTLLASKMVAPGGSVHAFEPAPLVYDILRANLHINGSRNIRLNRLAVSDTPGEAVLHINAQSGLTSMGDTGRGEFKSVEKVKTTTLDDYVHDHRIKRVDFLKIDIEGFEGHVLRGARQLLRSQEDMVIMVELAEKNYRPLGLSVNEVMGWVRQKGYDMWEIDEQLQRMVFLSASKTEYLNQNFVFTRKGSPRGKVLSSLIFNLPAKA